MSRLARYQSAILAALSVGAVVLVTTDDLPGASVPEEIAFSTSDGAEIHAHLYGAGEHAVVLAHGAVFDKESWQPLANDLSDRGLQVLALDFRGYGRSTPAGERTELWRDVLGAAALLQQLGAERISALGGSMGGGAVARASVESPAGTFHKLVLLAAAPIQEPERMKAEAFLFLVSREERLLPRVQQQFEQAPDPKRLEILEGSAHAQHIFRTDQAETLTRLIVEFLAE